MQHLAQLVTEVQHAGKDFDSDSERMGRKLPGAARAASAFPLPDLQTRGFENRQLTPASTAAQVSTAHEAGGKAASGCCG